MAAGDDRALPEHDAVGLVVFPLAALGGGMAVLWVLVTALKALAAASSFAWAAGRGELGRAVQPVAAAAKRALETGLLGGPISALKVGLTEVLLAALLVVAVGAWRTAARAAARAGASAGAAARAREGAEDAKRK